ncbi:MAG: methyltransferase domain-containing protein [Nanoarchaeota archaeon]
MIKKLNFGAGRDKREEWDNIDKEDFDFNKFPYPIKNNTYDFIEARQVLQLLENSERVLEEFWRISKKDAIIYIQVAYFNNKGAHNDIKTKYYFNENSFKFFVEHPAEINQKKHFEIISIYREPS